MDREPLIERFRETRGFTEHLCKPLEIEDYVIQSFPEASPAKWHLAHTSWFFETFILNRSIARYQSHHPLFEYLFNSYYHAVGAQYHRPERGLLSRPTVREVYAYRHHVDEAMIQLLESLPDARLAESAPVVLLGLNHEQQHQELLLTDLKHLFSRNPLRPTYQESDARPGGAIPSVSYVEFPEEIVEFGDPDSAFAFDNERPRHRRLLHPFAIMNRPIVNGEFLLFIQDGGYRSPQLWLSDGWEQVRQQGWEAPLYWERSDGTWSQRRLSGCGPIDPAEPVCHLSYYEADAFARWAGARLPTEFEWERAARDCAVAGNFVESGSYHPEPIVGVHKRGIVSRLFGDVWEWTRSPYDPYPGYAPPEGALGEYNGKFMCNQFVLRGGSCVTPQSHIRPTYRNFFSPGARWQFSGLRLAKEVS